MQSFSAGERCGKILTAVKSAGRISVGDLIALLGVSPATVRRDLGELVESGALERVRGGVHWPGEGLGEQPHGRRRSEALVQKRAIARAAASDVPKGASVFLDSGTTCHELGVLLAVRKDVVIYTTSASLLTVVETCAAHFVFLGGECRPVSLAMVGAVTLDWIARLRPDIAFIGATALDRGDGLFTTETSEAAVKAAAIKQARRAVLLADSSKAHATAAVQFAKWPAIAEWITDRGLPAKSRWPVSVRRV